MSLWDVFGEKSTLKSTSSISSKPSKLPTSPNFEDFESIEIIDSSLKQGLRDEPIPLPDKDDKRAMPEPPSTIDQEHGGAASDTMETPRDDGPDEFAAHVEQVRGAWPDEPPMIAQDMPDWSAFCVGWWRECFNCPCYDGDPNGSPCTLWEAAFPSKVRWYPPTN
jgi:hypothetical protein